MNNSNLLKLIYISASVVLIVSFIILVLEKSQIINLYSKPVVTNSESSRPVNDVVYLPADPTDNEEINAKKESGELGNIGETKPQPGAPINVVLTAANQDSPGGPVVVRVLLTDVTNGICDITITKNGITKSYQRNVVNAGTYYNCDVLDIPLSDLSAGNWNLNVIVTSGDRSGTASQNVEVKS